jgi:hypothetical protein|nr:MAG TPA_asm: hypothetical protein [Caudoviricetes sp.]
MSVIYGNPIIAGGGGLELVANVADGATVTATLGGKTVTGVSSGGQVRLKIPQEGKWTVSATSGMLVSVPQEISVPATIDIALVAQELNDTSWAAIKQVSDAGKGTDFWSIGDCKQITMNGKVSDGLTLTNYSAWVYIIGFNHNAEREGNGIAFQGFKATKNGTPVCLTDSGYNSSYTSGTWFNMNNANTNVGGWEASLMRKNVMPFIKASFPADLKAVIKPSTIYTDNKGGNPQTTTTPTATQDEVFILAEYEIFGKRTYANGLESNYQQQYAYYAAGNSKVNYRHNATSTAAYWWERSPASGTSATFCDVTASGSANLYSAYFSFGVSPAFKI